MNDGESIEYEGSSDNGGIIDFEGSGNNGDGIDFDGSSSTNGGSTGRKRKVVTVSLRTMTR